MILSGKEIEKNMGGKIVIEPFRRERLNPNSYNLSLAPELLVYDAPVLDMKKPNPVKRLVIPETGLQLEPNRLYLGRTNEYTKPRALCPCWRGAPPPGGWGCSSM